MSRLKWQAEGIERAVKAGGVELEVYRQPGFGRGKGVRVPNEVYVGSGSQLQEREWPFRPDDLPIARDPDPPKS